MKMRKLLLAIPVVLLFGCSNKHARVCHNPTYLEECYDLFEQIIRIQDTRKVSSLAMEESTLAFREGRMTEAEHSRKSHKWLMEENMLATHVARLYETARGKRCFDEDLIEHFAR